MDTLKKHSISKLLLAGAMLLALSFTTEVFAQDSTTVETTVILEAVAAEPIEASAAPTNIGDLINGLNTIWMLLAAMLVFFMQIGRASWRERVSSPV